MLVNQKLVSNGKRKAVELLIVHVNDATGQIAVSDLLDQIPRRPKILNVLHVEEMLRTGAWRMVPHDFPDELFVIDELINKKHLIKRDKAWMGISPLVEDEGVLSHYLYGSSKGIVAELVERSGTSKKFITTSINRYFSMGGFKNSLLPQYFFCGKQFSLREAPESLVDGTINLASKPGRETKYGNPFRQVTQLDVDNIRKFSTKIRNGQQVVLEDIYKEFCGSYLSTVIKPKEAPDEDIAEPFRMVLDRRNLISSRAFKRQLNKIIGRLDWIRKRVGQKSYERDHAGKTGVAHKGLRGPTSRYEIDSTVADIYIRYPFSNELLSIGRPIIYFVIDTVTGMIVGVHVCFHGPDWHGAGQALLNAFTEKVAFCKQFGVDIKEDDWPCHHVCRELTGDRGTENSDKNLSSLVKGLIGVSIVNLNAYHRGDCKGTVEKTFDTAQKRAITYEAGRVEKVYRYEDKHASRRALYTYDEFMSILIKTILISNNTTERINGRTFEMERDDVAFTSRDAWLYGLSNMMITPTISRDRLIFALLPEVKGTIRAQGVFFRGLFYSSDEFEKLKKIDEAKNFGRKQIAVRYTDCSTNHIWYRDDETRVLYQLNLTDRSEAYKNQVWASVMHRLEIVKGQLALLSEKRFTAEVINFMDLRRGEDQLKRNLKGLKKTKAKGIAAGIKERGAVEGIVQKHQDGKNMIAELSGGNTKTEMTQSAATNTWVDPTSVPYEEVYHG